MSKLKEYLGDSVYADVSDTGMIVLTTENSTSEDPSNEIYIEPAVYHALAAYASRLHDLGIPGFNLIGLGFTK